MKSKNFGPAINEIMKHFDWRKVERTMTALNWVWGFHNRVPTIEEMKGVVLELFEDALKQIKEIENHPTIIERETSFSTGGFKVAIRGNKTLELSFVVERWEETRG